MPVVNTHVRAAAGFRPERFTPVVIAETERVKVILACFEPGQFIPVHRPGVDLVGVVLEGEGDLIAGGEESRITAGSVFVVPAGEARGIRATSRLVVLHTVSPPPGPADHDQVRAGLERGTWR